MIASSHCSRRSATGCTGDVCGSGWVLVLPVTPEVTAFFVAVAEAAPAPPAALPRRASPAGEAGLNDRSRPLNARGSTTLATPAGHEQRGTTDGTAFGGFDGW